MAEHTPGQLTVDQWGAVIAEDGERLLLTGLALSMGRYGSDDRRLSEANRDRLVLAWNTHDDLYAALRDLVNYYDQAGIGPCLEGNDDEDGDGFDGDERANVRAARSALAKARGETMS